MSVLECESESDSEWDMDLGVDLTSIGHFLGRRGDEAFDISEARALRFDPNRCVLLSGRCGIVLSTLLEGGAGVAGSES
jgi:hypothetical protein